MGLAHAGQTYENICANPADYDGNAQYLSDGNCSTAIGSKNVWSNINWTTVTCSDLSESDTYTTLNSVGKVCCGGKRTICTPDYSKICKDPSKYTPDATYTNGPVGGKCGSYTVETWKNVTSWNSVQCSEFTGDSNNMQTAKGYLNTVFTKNCCSDKQNLCDKDYSKLCSDPSTYQGTKLWKSGATLDCDGMIKKYFQGEVNWTNPTCISEMETYSRCCSNDKTMCSKDISTSTTTAGPSKVEDTSNSVHLRSDTKVFFITFFIWIGLLH
jgi:hypothetical protein